MLIPLSLVAVLLLNNPVILQQSPYLAPTELNNNPANEWFCKKLRRSGQKTIPTKCMSNSTLSML